MSYSLKKIDSFSLLLKNEWLSITNTNISFEYSSCFEWCSLWWTHFGQQYDLEIHIIYNGDKPECLLPLYRYKGTLYSIGTYPDNFDSLSILYSNERALSFLWSHLIQNEKSFELRYIPSDSAVTQTLIKSLYSLGKAYYSSVIDLKPYTQLDRFNPKKKLRDDIKRCKNRLSEVFDGSAVNLIFHTSSVQAFDDFIACHIERWEGGPLASSDNTKNFWRDLYLNSDKVLLVSLSVESEDIAWMLCIIDNDSQVTSIYPAYKKIYSKYSPGKVLCYDLMKSLSGDDFKFFDFGRGAEGYKFWFNHGQKTLVNIKYSESLLCKIFNMDSLRLLYRKFLG